jgi:hypothetical protein
MLPKGLPEHSLGWDVLDWGTEYLAQPDGDYQGEPWVYSDEQALFILWFYAVDEDGKFIYRKAVLERPKGWGKSPLLAAICCTEFMGPVRFDGWDANGRPVGKPSPTPLVQIAAISDSQAENTYALCREMMLQGEIMYEYPQLDIMLAKSTYPGNRKLEKVTASPRGREGNRATFVVMDETHLWVPAEQGPELHEALSRNLAKMGGRFIETTNAPVPGQNSVAEKTHDAYEKMRATDVNASGLLFDTREVEIDDIYDKEKAWPALRYVYGDAADPETGWIDLDRIWAEITDPQYGESVSRRFYFNQRVRPPSAWLNYAEWMDCYDPHVKASNGDKIALGFKGTINRSAAALIGFRLTDGALFNFGIWEKQEGGMEGDKWEANWDEIDARVRNVIDHYDVIKLVADPVSRRDVISEWYADYGIVEEFWLSNRAKFGRAVQQFEQFVTAKHIKWEDPVLSKHVLNCHAEEIPGDLYIIRQDTKWSDRFIGAAQAACLAVEAAALAIQDGALAERKNTVFSFSNEGFRNGLLGKRPSDEFEQKVRRNPPPFVML